MRRPSSTVSLPAIAVWAVLLAAPAHAAPLATPASPATSDVSMLALASPGTRALAPEVEAVQYDSSAQGNAPPRDAAWYHPGGSGWSEPELHTAFEFFGGAYAAKGQTKPTTSDFGFRVGPPVTKQVQLGLAFDWLYRHYAERTSAGTPYQEAGATVTPQRLVSEASSHLFPTSAFLQFKIPLGPIAPYAGVGGGYELLYLTAQDYQTGQTRDATFGGWGWQTWAGMKLSLGGVVRLNGELFLNQCIVERDVQDIVGQTYQERVDVTGGGLRVGMAFGF